jgi:hypothetical protein
MLLIKIQDRDKAEVSLISLTRQHHDAEERLRELYEQRLAEVHKEAALLRGKVDRLESESAKVATGSLYQMYLFCVNVSSGLLVVC